MCKALLELIKALWLRLKDKWNDKRFRRLVIVAGLLFLYLAGVIAQFLNNRHNWTPGRELRMPSINPLKGLAMLFTPFGAQALIGLFFFITVAVLLFFLFREDRHGMKYDKERNFWYGQKGVYGTAGWMEDKDIRRCFDLTPVEEAHTVKEIIYGEKDGFVLSRKPDSMLTEHVAVLGSSGSMKSRAYVRGKIISSALKGESICVCDPKGELASDTFRYLENSGYTCKILNLVDPRHSARYDGLDGCRDDLVFVANIVEAVISNTGGAKGDHFFDAAEGNLLSALIYWQLEQDTGEWPSLKGAYQMLTGCKSVEELNDWFDMYPNSQAARAYNLFRMASLNVQGNVIIGLGSRLSVMMHDEIAELMCYPDMDFLALGKEKTAYFLVLNDQNTSMKFVSAMFFSILFERLVRFADNECPGKKLPVKVNLILDEMCSVVGAINGLHIKMSTIRSRNITVSAVFQGIGQLMNRYPQNMWSEILSATDCMLVLGCNDPVSAEYVSDRSGELTIYADTTMKNRNIFLPSMLQPVYRHSEGAGRRQLLTPDEVLRMDHSEMLVMLRGEQVLKLNKFDYTRNAQSRRFEPVEVRGLVEIRQPDAMPDRLEELTAAREQAAAATAKPDNALLDSQGNPVRNEPFRNGTQIVRDMGTAPGRHMQPERRSPSHTADATAGKEVARDVESDGARGDRSHYIGPTSSKTGPPKI